MFSLFRTEHGSLARRDKSSSSHGKNSHDNHHQGSLRSSSSTLSTHRTSTEKHGRWAQLKQELLFLLLYPPRNICLNIFLNSNRDVAGVFYNWQHIFRRIYPSYDETIGRTGDDFLTNNGYKGNVTPVSNNNNPYSPVTNSNSNSSSGELIGSARVSHEHTDSGLGADQDYAYSSERYLIKTESHTLIGVPFLG